MFGEKSKDHAERFGYLLKAKEKSITVFRKAHENLTRTMEEIRNAAQACQTGAYDLEEAAKEERKAAEYLQQEGLKIKATADKLAAIIGE